MTIIRRAFQFWHYILFQWEGGGLLTPPNSRILPELGMNKSLSQWCGKLLKHLPEGFKKNASGFMIKRFIRWEDKKIGILFKNFIYLLCT